MLVKSIQKSLCSISFEKARKTKYGQRSQYCTIHPDKTIHDLPEEAKYRERLNAGKEIRYEQLRQKAVLLLWVDRKSRILVARGGGASVSSQKVHDAIKEAFKKDFIQKR